jgi:hypothetical protein
MNVSANASSGEAIRLRRCLFQPLPDAAAYCLVVRAAAVAMRLAAAVRCATAIAMRRSAAMGLAVTMRRAAVVMSWRRVRATVVASVAVISAATGIAAMIGHISAPAVITSATAIDEAMVAPAVPVSPTGPRAHAQEDAVVEIPWPIKSHGRASVRCVVVVAVRATRWNAANVDHDLCVSCWHKSQAREQRCCTE